MLTRFVTRDVDHWFAALAESPRLPGDVVTVFCEFMVREVAKASQCEAAFFRAAFLRRFPSGKPCQIYELEVGVDHDGRAEKLLLRAVRERLDRCCRQLGIAQLPALPHYLHAVAARETASPRTLADAPPAEATPDVASATPDVAPGVAAQDPAAASEAAPLPEAVASDRAALHQKYPWLKGRF